MKRFLCALLALILGCGMLAGCSVEEETVDGPRIVVTIFPLYDWAKTLLGDRGTVTMLMRNGVDLHNYQPSAADIADIMECDMLIYVGGESDEWVEDLLESCPDHAFKTLNLMQTLRRMLLEEEQKEGMQAEEEEEDGALDEHIWLSLRNAGSIVESIAESVAALEPEYRSEVLARAAEYRMQLDALDERYEAVCADAVRKTILVADRFPFRYLVEDYGLDYYAAFPGCAAASDVSAETIGFLQEKLEQLQLPALFIIDGSDGALAENLRENANRDVKILTLNSAQCVSQQEIQDGVTYLKLMEENLTALEEALN